MERIQTGSRCPAIFAGLMAGFGVAVTLTAFPVVASAEEVPALAATEQDSANRNDDVLSEDLASADFRATVEEYGFAASENGFNADKSTADNSDDVQTDAGPALDQGKESFETAEEDKNECHQDPDEPLESAGVEKLPVGQAPDMGNIVSDDAESSDEIDLINEDASKTAQPVVADAVAVERNDSLQQAAQSSLEPGLSLSAPLPASGWVVEDRGDGLQRYYVCDGESVTGLFSAVIDGITSWFYGREDLGGAVVRGKWDNGCGRVYLADNDGRLASLGADGCGSGWLVTDEYDGSLQRYWIDGSAHAAVSGYFVVDAQGRLAAEGSEGDSYFGLGGQGYVLRGTSKGVRSDWLVADNDGKLARNEWVVTGAFGQGLQRYWFDDTATIAREGLYDTGGGWWTYVTDRGYVLRGKLDTGRGRIYLANNDGRLASLGADGRGSGWLVTGEYDGGALQRYYIDGAAHAAVSGFFTVGSTPYFGMGGQGYVLRGTTPWGSVVLIADNDGVMPSSEGWIVSSAYGQGLQRYFAAPVSGQKGFFGALKGYFSVEDNHAVAGSDYYGLSAGYVLRGGAVINGQYVYANNDGLIVSNLSGIDISAYQDGIDLASIAANFVIVKATEGVGYTSGTLYKFADVTLNANKKLGLYHFYDSSSTPEAQADYFVSKVGQYIGKAVLVLDWENNDLNGTNNLSGGPAIAKRFLDRVYERTGVRPLIYMSASVTREYDWSGVANAGYGLWVAQYLNDYYKPGTGIHGYVDDPRLSSSGFGAWGSSVTMYQYTSTGKLDGWSGLLDFNVFYGSNSDWDALAAAQMAKAAVQMIDSFAAL